MWYAKVKVCLLHSNLLFFRLSHFEREGYGILGGRFHSRIFDRHFQSCHLLYSSIMDPIVTWEILSRLAEARGGNRDDGSVDSLPFYAQRICKKEDTNTSLIQEESLFFKTSPTIHDTTQSPPSDLPSDEDTKPSNTTYSSPTIYSLKAITEKFMRILQQQDRVSVAELCKQLGMKEDDVSAVGDLICKSSSSLVCKVYNNVRKQYEYGLVESLKQSLHDRINFHCNLSSTAPLEDNKSLHSIVSSLAQLSTVTIKQLSKELELSCEDILRLLKDIGLHPNICISKHNGEITGYYNSEIKENSMQYIEKEILSCLDEATTPSSVCISAECAVCTYFMLFISIC